MTETGMMTEKKTASLEQHGANAVGRHSFGLRLNERPSPGAPQSDKQA